MHTNTAVIYAKIVSNIATIKKSESNAVNVTINYIAKNIIATNIGLFNIFCNTIANNIVAIGSAKNISKMFITLFSPILFVYVMHFTNILLPTALYFNIPLLLSKVHVLVAFFLLFVYLLILLFLVFGLFLSFQVPHLLKFLLLFLPYYIRIHFL